MIVIFIPKCKFNVCGDEHHYVLICLFIKPHGTMYLKH